VFQVRCDMTKAKRYDTVVFLEAIEAFQKDERGIE
jgi:hypothetical protein